MSNFLKTKIEKTKKVLVLRKKNIQGHEQFVVSQD